MKRTYYHGTNLENARKIIKEGLVNPLAHDSQWYLLATDLNSAKIYQKQSTVEPLNHYVIEFEMDLPDQDLGNDILWDGYPMLWGEYKFNDEKVWVSPREVVPASMIVAIYKMNVHDCVLERLSLTDLGNSEKKDLATGR